MKNAFRHFLPAITLLSSSLIPASAHADGAVSERVYFIQQDGRHALVYTTSRSNFSSYNLWFDKQTSDTTDSYLADFHYLFPDPGGWSSREDGRYRVLNLPSGDFTSLKWADLETHDRLKVDEEGIYYFRNWNDAVESKTSEGHYGLWNSPGDFEQLACSWVFPENLKPVTYHANRDGDWQQRHNTLTYYGQHVNDLFFAIEYRPASGDTYKALQDLKEEGVEIEQQATGVKMTLAETLLFPSGVAEISNTGKRLLDKLADSLKQQSALKVVVSGHTDNVPIGAELTKRFQSNWELSSKRAINIIHYLVAQGVTESRFEAHAFSFMRPLASNTDEVGRSKNRRIEIILTDANLNPDAPYAPMTEAPSKK